MIDRDHSDHISKLSDSDLESLYKSLTGLKSIADTFNEGVKAGSKINIEGLEFQVNVSDIGWIPDLTPVEKALRQVHEEIIERELLRDE